jgi:methionine-rich copper-binding protein CopC
VKRQIRRILAVGAVAAALGGTSSAPSVEAHAVLVRSAPAGRATVSHTPERVDLWFSEPLEPAFSTISVWSASGARVDRKNGAVTTADPKQLSVAIDPIGAGTYTVRFRVLSVDGHVVESSFPFTVKPKP